MRRSHVVLSLVCILLAVASAQAQFKQRGQSRGTTLGEAKPQRWKVGLILTATRIACNGATGYIPVPMEWPEQEVRVVDEDVSPSAKIKYRTIDGTVKLMVVKIRRLPVGQEAKALVTFEITHRPQLPPDVTDEYVLADTKKLPRNIRRYLGTSPYIDSRHAKIRKLAKEIGVDEKTAWEQVEAVYDWIRDKIEYRRGPIKSALAALKDGTGDCEEMTSLFIAICRAKGIPARVVHVQGHCYPEFYLEDAQGRGHWFPCQMAGDRSFGGIPETRPIWQKGDNFRSLVKEHERVRYLYEVLKVTAKSKPRKPKWVRQRVGK